MTDKNRDLVLKRCFFEDGYNGSLEQVILSIYSALPNHEDRVFDGGTLFKKYRLASVDQLPNDKGIYVRIVALDQNPMGIVNLTKSTSTLGVDEHAPPSNSEWLDEDLFLLIKNNEIISCVSGRKDKVIEYMIWHLGVEGKVFSTDFKFNITDVANQNEISKINKIGVKSIDFDIGDYLCELDTIKSATSRPGSEVLPKIFGKPSDAASKRRRANTSGKLTLRRGKFKKDEIKKDEWITDIGKTLVEVSNVDYDIVLEDGSKISTRQLKVLKRVKIPTHANTICINHTRAELQQFYSELVVEGKLGV